MQCKKPKEVGAIAELRKSKGANKMNTEEAVGSLAVKLSRAEIERGRVTVKW